MLAVVYLIFNEGYSSSSGGPLIRDDLCREAIRLGRLWDRALIAEGQGLVRHCLRRNRPGPYQLQAAISAVHSGPRRRDSRSAARRTSRRARCRAGPGGVLRSGRRPLTAKAPAVRCGKMGENPLQTTGAGADIRMPAASLAPSMG
ncbi:DUF6596 domain-containing protein [Arthrobacter sp. U41]|uniref:DUF6596 domain-containing protein n=1 Tax=Arthrobacter sp. U41 TaxID=1849032 RepID=UPI002F917010